uniref:F-box domain-containing protein n=1 Tax=Setaria digitata TaxID=48799 RepID=A0A915Q4X7_9BILA
MSCIPKSLDGFICPIFWIVLFRLKKFKLRIPYMASTPTGCSNMVTPAEINLNTLPVEIITYILNCLSYDDISSLRAVSKSFDSVARSILNKSFFRLGEQLDKAMSRMKKMLPKRESQRRLHTLSRVNEVYSALETRYALLSMTFRKYIDNDTCCFIAGKVLDEGFSVLRMLDNCVKRRIQPPETQESLRDIRDYSSMAMEYFEEQIAPALRIRDPLSLLCRSHSRYSLESLPNSFSSATLSDSVRSLYSTPSNIVISRSSTSPMTRSISDYTKMNQWKRRIDEKVKQHERIIAEQDRVIREQSKAINSIIECMHQVSSKISFNFMKELKAVEELSQPSSPPAGPSGKMKNTGKRKANTVLCKKTVKRSN